MRHTLKPCHDRSWPTIYTAGCVAFEASFEEVMILQCNVFSFSKQKRQSSGDTVIFTEFVSKMELQTSIALQLTRICMRNCITKEPLFPYYNGFVEVCLRILLIYIWKIWSRQCQGKFCPSSTNCNSINHKGDLAIQMKCWGMLSCSDILQGRHTLSYWRNFRIRRHRTWRHYPKVVLSRLRPCI